MGVSAILASKGRDVVTAAPEDPVGQVAGLLETHGIGAVVIVSNSRVVGIFSERDFLRALVREGARAVDRPVAEFMTRKVETCRPEDGIAELMRRMTAGKFRHLPVVESGRLTGIVSIGDVVKQRIAEAEAEAQAMREYIATA